MHLLTQNSGSEWYSSRTVDQSVAPSPHPGLWVRVTYLLTQDRAGLCRHVQQIDCVPGSEAHHASLVSVAAAAAVPVGRRGNHSFMHDALKVNAFYINR